MKDQMASEMGLSRNVFHNSCAVKMAEIYSESKFVKRIGDIKEVTI